MLKKRFLGSISALLILGGAALCTAAEFQPLGYDAISMGGAGVASSRGSYAPYYNPALLAKPRHSTEIALSVGVGIREINLVDHIDTLAEIDINDTMDALSNLDYGDITLVDEGGEIPDVQLTDQTISDDVKTIKKELRALSTKNGLQIMPNVALSSQMGHWGVGAFTLSEVSAFAVIDDNRLDAIVPYDYEGTTYYVKYDEEANTFSRSNEDEYSASSIEYAVDNEHTYLELTGLVYGEVPVSYAYTVPFIPGSFSIGGSFKFMSAATFHSVISIDSESSEITDDISDSQKNDSTWGVDLGAIYSPPNMNWLTFGLVGKNLNSPEFATEGGDPITIDPQIRAGAAMNLFNDKLSLAFDMDLSTNDTYVDNYKARFVGGGVSWHPLSWFSLRGGAMQNMEESDEGLILTAGMGFGLKWFQLDIAGQMSTESGEYDGQEIPRYGRVQLALVSKWN